MWEAEQFCLSWAFVGPVEDLLQRMADGAQVVGLGELTHSKANFAVTRANATRHLLHASTQRKSLVLAAMENDGTFRTPKRTDSREVPGFTMSATAINSAGAESAAPGGQSIWFPKTEQAVSTGKPADSIGDGQRRHLNDSP
jgi:hypothetical protein